MENTFRDPKTRGCGVGDIRFMFETKDLGGKHADLNALYVGLAGAAGLPARDVYGIRVAKSELGYKSLGKIASVLVQVTGRRRTPPHASQIHAILSTGTGLVLLFGARSIASLNCHPMGWNCSLVWFVPFPRSAN